MQVWARPRLQVGELLAQLLHLEGVPLRLGLLVGEQRVALLQKGSEAAGSKRDPESKGWRRVRAGRVRACSSSSSRSFVWRASSSCASASPPSMAIERLLDPRRRIRVRVALLPDCRTSLRLVLSR